MNYKILEKDPYLNPYATDISLRMRNLENKTKELLTHDKTLLDFANAHHYYGFHKTKNGWIYREWAPGADSVYIMGDMNGWRLTSLPLKKLDNGAFEIELQGESTLYHGCKVKTVVEKNGKFLERIPLYATRVVQDPVTYSWCAEIVDTPAFPWKNLNFKPSEKLYIYECHIGMSGEEGCVNTYSNFTSNVLPRIKKLGYNTIQIMAIMEHPYYGSFGYQVSSFYAASSRYGTPDELKQLIDTAHGMGIGVLLDVVHSHAVKNTAEGINEFDGTDYQFFHQGSRGLHPAWDTKLFNYNKNDVIHFLLSNLKFWLEEYHFDGFRFDGVTSMIYHDHGLGTAFTSYEKYFSMNTDTEAITYLQLANQLIRQVNPNAITIAEDMSAMPGMCLPIEDGGIGFDYRLSMGIPDLWIKHLKEIPDEQWNMWHLWYELSNRRPGEKYIAYVESHDQALVGDKTVMFRLCDKEMYTNMSVFTQSPIIDRGIALHKLLRFVTMTIGGEGYLNFMGNEFGHPEWIDFPREGNGWSYHYCRRQWHLVDDTTLKYQYLNQFDKKLVSLTKRRGIFNQTPTPLFIDEKAQVLVYQRGKLIFAVNFNPSQSLEGYFVPTPKAGNYKIVLSSDDKEFGGFDRADTTMTYPVKKTDNNAMGFQTYLPARTALCFAPIE